MSNSFYNVGGVPGSKAPLSSSVVRTEFANIAVGFDKMPTLAGHGDELVKINSGGTATSSITFAALLATITNLAIAGALTGVTNLTTSGNTILGDAVGDTLNVANGALQVNAAGGVGVGAAAPAGTALSVVQATTTHLLLRSTTAAGYTSLRLYNDQNSSARALEIDYLGSTHASGEMGLIATTGAFPLTLWTANTERVRLDAAGSVLVGLTASLVGTAKLQISDGTINSLFGYKTGGVEYLGTVSNHPLALLANNAMRVTVMAAGPVVVNGTTNATIGGGVDQLAVVGSIGMTGGQLNANPGAGLSLEIVNRSTGGMRLYTNAGAVIALTIQPNGDASFAGSLASVAQFTVGPGGGGQMTANPGGAINTGYLQFVAANGNRQGYIGYATTTGATDTGTIPFIMAAANFSGALNVVGTAAAALFSGSGASLTALSATQLTTGTVPDARFPATLPAASGANLTALNASNLSSGTVALARLPTTIGNAQIDAAAAIAWTKIDKTGSSLADFTTRSATDLSSGTLANARLPAAATTITSVGATLNLVGGVAGALNIGGSITRFESAETACPSGTYTDTAAAHGGARVPDLWQVVLRCKTTEAGFAANDEVNMQNDIGDVTNAGYQTYANATNIGFQAVRSGATAPAIKHKTTGVLTTLTAANWKVVFRGYWL